MLRARRRSAHTIRVLRLLEHRPRSLTRNFQLTKVVRHLTKMKVIARRMRNAQPSLASVQMQHQDRTNVRRLGR